MTKHNTTRVTHWSNGLDRNGNTEEKQISQQRGLMWALQRSMELWRNAIMKAGKGTRNRPASTPYSGKTKQKEKLLEKGRYESKNKLP